jgi:hypothetical protein
MNNLKITIFFLIFSLILNSCGKFPGADAKKFPPDPKLRVAKNLEEGRGFRLSDMGKKSNGGGNFEFASSNELWRASLDTIDFIPLASVNYSGGIIITDWYSADSSTNENIKISIRFLTNEIRSDALDIKVFSKQCNLKNQCVVSEKNKDLVAELKKEILKKATLYSRNNPDKKIKPYIYSE